MDMFRILTNMFRILTILIIFFASAAVTFYIVAMANAQIDRFFAPLELGPAANLTFEKCCGGNICSDTYYDNTTGECVNTMCHKGSIFCRVKVD